MGVIVELSCPGGDYSDTFQLGQGMSDYDPTRIVSHFEQELGAEVEGYLAESDGSWRYDGGLGQCGRCHALREVPMLLHIGTADRYGSATCVCGGELHLWTSEEVEEMRGKDAPHCPHCGEPLLYRRTGYWD